MPKAEAWYLQLRRYQASALLHSINVLLYTHESTQYITLYTN